MAKTRKANSRRKRTRRRRQRGGKIIGQGGNGYAHYGKEGSEHVVCADGSEWKEGEVAKIGYGLTKELTRVKKIRAHYPEITAFAILPTRVCPADPVHYKEFLDSQPESDTKVMLTEYTRGEPEILFSPYGGKALSDVSGPEVVKALVTLREQVARMNEKGIYHNDIGEGNIVYKDGKAYLIDFGIASTPEDDFNPEESPDLEMMDAMIDYMKRKKGGVRRKSFQAKRRYQ